MDIFYRMTAHAALEFHGFGFFLMTPTESEVFFSCEIRSVQESLIEELIEYAIECRLIHLTRVDKNPLERAKGTRLDLFEMWADVTSVNSGEHRGEAKAKRKG